MIEIKLEGILLSNSKFLFPSNTHILKIQYPSGKISDSKILLKLCKDSLVLTLTTEKLMFPFTSTGIHKKANLETSLSGSSEIRGGGVLFFLLLSSSLSPFSSLRACFLYTYIHNFCLVALKMVRE